MSKFTVDIDNDFDLEAMLDETVDELVLTFHRNIVPATPIDKGDARRSWTADVANRTVESNSPYMNPLNDGHSDQAPRGFIEREISNLKPK